MPEPTQALRSDAKPSILLEFATTEDRQAFVTAMVNAKGRQMLRSRHEEAFRRVLSWGVR